MADKTSIVIDSVNITPKYIELGCFRREYPVYSPCILYLPPLHSSSLAESTELWKIGKHQVKCCEECKQLIHEIDNMDVRSFWNFATISTNCYACRKNQ